MKTIKKVDDFFNKTAKHIDNIYFPDVKYYRDNKKCTEVHYTLELFNNGCISFNKMVKLLSKSCDEKNDVIEKIVSNYLIFSKDIIITDVIFRKFKNDGEIIAFFPYIIEDTKGSVLSYMHTGQHGGANYTGLILDTNLATEAEYTPLKKELENLFDYNLRVIKKQHYNTYIKEYKKSIARRSNKEVTTTTENLFE